MNVQVFGFTDCQDTRKALRFFAERRIPVHFVDLAERPAARGELRRFAERFGPAALIDREGARFRALGLRVAGDSPQRLLDRALTEPRLLRTPLVRDGGKVTVGHAPEDWQAWLAAVADTGARRPAARG
ncbi:MAG TPA: arsenate reductase family protein [Methylomirabilota bacterium]|nr:arsenate reductase family protein [Methylomirabilota bacterium]